MEDGRLEIYREVSALFAADEQVREIVLRGSLTEGRADRFSDIDIGIDVSGGDNAAFALAIPERMHRHFDLHFHDWAGSLMPEQYVISFFVKGQPLFWNIDIDCTAAPHNGRLQRNDIDEHPIAHRLKVWPMACKYLLRGADGAEAQIRRHAGNVLPGVDVADWSAPRILRAILDELHDRAGGDFAEFFADCYALWDEEFEGAAG